MKLISWNVNGLRACMEKGFLDFLNEAKADFFCIQETKMQESQSTFLFEGYHQYWSSAIKLGYSGTLILAKEKPLNVFYGIEGKYCDEGRMITLEYDQFYLVNIYSPNSQRHLLRLDYRMTFETDLNAYLVSLKSKKNVIICGDLNVAHQEIDLKNPKSNLRNAGFTIEERTKFSDLLEQGFIDTFRTLHPDTIKYSWWSYMFHARKNNIGWRIDYFLVDNNYMYKVKEAFIYNEIMGSNHCPVRIIIDR